MTVFNEQFSNGIPFMDASVKRFISELNKLATAMKNGEGREYLAFILDYLEDFCENQLALENKVMLQYNFYDYANHVEIHARFREELGKIRDKFEKNGADFSMPLTLQRMMSEWLLKHVAKADMVLGDYLRAKLAKHKSSH